MRISALSRTRPRLLACAVVWMGLLAAPIASSAADKTEKVDKPDKSKAPRAQTAKPEKPDAAKGTSEGRADAGNKRARVHTFTGLDVEGKLKTPQLLYFRSRMKQELDTSTPEKRSFMQELGATASADGL